MPRHQFTRAEARRGAATLDAMYKRTAPAAAAARERRDHDINAERDCCGFAAIDHGLAVSIRTQRPYLVCPKEEREGY